MRFLYGLVFILFIFPSLIWAADVTLKWDMPKTTAPFSGFRIYQSDDGGKTWAFLREVNATARTCKLIDVADDHLIMWRVSAFNHKQEAVRTDSGAWYNGLWVIPPKPKSTGAELQE